VIVIALLLLSTAKRAADYILGFVCCLSIIKFCKRYTSKTNRSHKLSIDKQALISGKSYSSATSEFLSLSLNNYTFNELYVLCYSVRYQGHGQKF